MTDVAAPTTAWTAPGQRAIAGAIAATAAAALCVVWGLEARGYVPCELCILERRPLEVAVVLAIAVAALMPRASTGVARTGWGALALTLAVGAALGARHAGVEWHLWAGPGGCTGTMDAPRDVDAFLAQLRTVSVVRCDEAALRVAGVSLAGWDALLCAGLAALAAVGLRRA